MTQNFTKKEVIEIFYDDKKKKLRARTKTNKEILRFPNSLRKKGAEYLAVIYRNGKTLKPQGDIIDRKTKKVVGTFSKNKFFSTTSKMRNISFSLSRDVKQLYDEAIKNFVNYDRTEDEEILWESEDLARLLWKKDNEWESLDEACREYKEDKINPRSFKTFLNNAFNIINNNQD